MGRRPAEMLGVAELACQIFLKEIVIGGVDRTAESFRVDRMPDSRGASCLWLHERICDLAGRHLLRNAILWMGAFVVQATSLVAASNPQLPVPGT